MKNESAIPKAGAVLILVIFLVWPTLAVQQPVGEKTGMSGFVNVGTAYMRVKTNMVTGNELTSFDNSTISSIYSGPDTDDGWIPLLNGELRYTLGDTRTQIYLGNQLEDVLQFESGTLLGVRQELDDKGTAAISYVFSGIATEVWKDPYVANVKRSETDLTTNGLRLEWDRIWGSNVGVEYQQRQIEIDDELSGTLGGLGLTPAEIGRLDREGDNCRGEVYYTWRLGGGHSLVPAVRFGRNDRHGSAMSSDVYALRLAYAFNSEKYGIVATGFFGNEEFDTENPIYLKTRNDDTYGLGLTAFLHQPFGWPKGFSLAGTVGYYESDSNISFYDSQVFMVGTSVLYNF